MDQRRKSGHAAAISLPLDLPRDIQLEYHSPANWKKVESYKHIRTAPMSYGTGGGPLQEEDANVLASREREFVATRRAVKAARKIASEESLRVRLARLAKERHAAQQKEAPVLASADLGPGVKVRSHQTNAGMKIPSTSSSRDSCEPDAMLARPLRRSASGRSRLPVNEGSARETVGPRLRSSRFERHVQGCEVAGAVAQKARTWLQDKSKELQDSRPEEQVGQASLVGCALQEERMENEVSSSTQQEHLRSESNGECESRIEREIGARVLTEMQTCQEDTSTCSTRTAGGGQPEAVPVAATMHGKQNEIKPASRSTIEQVKVHQHADVNSLASELGSSGPGSVLVEQSSSTAEGWHVTSELDPSRRDTSSPREEAARSLHFVRVVREMEPETSRRNDNETLGVTDSGSPHAENGRPRSQRHSRASQGSSLAEEPFDSDSLRKDGAPRPRIRGGPRKREVFDEHGMGGQYFAAVWRSYAEWERQKGQGWAHKQQNMEQERKESRERERQLEIQAILEAQRRAAKEEEEALLRARLAAQDRARARAEQERTERVVRELENERFSSAMLAKLSEKALAMGIDVPPLCGCQHATWPLDPAYTALCASNCEVRRSWDVYQKTLSDILCALNLF